MGLADFVAAGTKCKMIKVPKTSKQPNQKFVNSFSQF